MTGHRLSALFSSMSSLREIFRPRAVSCPGAYTMFTRPSTEDGATPQAEADDAQYLNPTAESSQTSFVTTRTQPMIFILPPELLADVLLQVISDAQSWMDSLRELSLVCKAWNEAVAETPAFYARIELSYKRPAVKHFLAQSREAPLNISCLGASYPSQTDPFAELLRPHATRIRSFKHNGSEMSFLDSLVTHVRDLEVHYPGWAATQTVMLALPGTEPLRNFSNHAMWVSWDSPRLVQLRSLCLSEIRFMSPTMLQILQILDASPCLEVLRLVDVGTNLEDPFRDDAPESRNKPLIPKIHLPFLKTLEMKRIPPHVFLQIMSDVFATASFPTETENLHGGNLVKIFSKVILPSLTSVKRHVFDIHFRRVWDGRTRSMQFQRKGDVVSFDVCPGEREIVLSSLSTALSRISTPKPATLNLTTDPEPKRRLGLHLSTDLLNGLSTVDTISLGHRIDAGTLLCRLAKPVEGETWLCPNLKQVYVQDVEEDFMERFTSLGWEDQVARPGMWVDCAGRAARSKQDAAASSVNVESRRLDVELDGLSGLFEGSDW